MKIQRLGSAFFLGLFLLTGLHAGGQTVGLEKEQALADLKTLASDAYQGRETGTEGGEKARDYIKMRLEEMGLKPYHGQWFQPFTATDRDGQELAAINVAGYIPGTESGCAIVIGAHYDHLGIRSEKIYNGADDNASGTAALLALASYFASHPPKHTLIFVAFDAEEKGLQGSRHFVKEINAEDSILFNLNFDMISRSEAREIFASGTHHTPTLKSRMGYLVDQDKWGALLRFGHDKPRSHRQDWTYASDHGSFFREGIPFLYFGVEDHEDYHQETDVYDKIDPDFYLGVLGILLETSLLLDQQLEEILTEE